MRLIKIYNKGNILKPHLFEEVKKIDTVKFEGHQKDFKVNSDWWCIEKDNIIIAYCGMTYLKNENAVFLSRAWVDKSYRGQGLQKRMIKTRLKAAKGYKSACTYTVLGNSASSNSLIKMGFKFYNPMYYFAGKDVIYFIKELKKS